MKFDNKCNLHSWGVKNKKHTTPATSCCYPSNHSNANCMWAKPKEFDKNWRHGNGYEISAWYSASMTSSRALNQWKRSSGHNKVILEIGGFSGLKYIGAAVYGGYASVWFAK